jgi:endonuclease/exonuclease/phosphatase family metal-dependent hydrolase
MRLVSYNIHKGIGGRDRAYRLERIVRVIEHEQPDIICLQEVDRNVGRSRKDHQPRLIAKHFGFESAFQLNHRVRRGGYGNLVLSRWPISERHDISLRMGRRKNRGAQVVIVRTPAGMLRLANLHLGLSEAERHWQIGQFLASPAFRKLDGQATMVVGDFNDWRNSLADGPLPAYGLRLLTSPPSRFRTFPAWWRLASLDKAFGSEQVRVHRAHVAADKLARAASDHLPLVIDFELIRQAHTGGGGGVKQ